MPGGTTLQLQNLEMKLILLPKMLVFFQKIELINFSYPSLNSTLLLWVLNFDVYLLEKEISAWCY